MENGSGDPLAWEAAHAHRKLISSRPLNNPSAIERQNVQSQSNCSRLTIQEAERTGMNSREERTWQGVARRCRRKGRGEGRRRRRRGDGGEAEKKCYINRWAVGAAGLRMTGHEDGGGEMISGSGRHSDKSVGLCQVERRTGSAVRNRAAISFLPRAPPLSRRFSG